MCALWHIVLHIHRPPHYCEGEDDGMFTEPSARSYTLSQSSDYTKQSKQKHKTKQTKTKNTTTEPKQTNKKQTTKDITPEKPSAETISNINKSLSLTKVFKSMCPLNLFQVLVLVSWTLVNKERSGTRASC